MIRSVDTDGRLRLVADLPEGHVAYLDADWTSAGPADAVPALVLGGGVIQRAGAPSLPVPSGVDPDRAAALSLFAVAREAFALCEQQAPSKVEVEGHGVIASAIRALAADQGTSGDGGAGTGRPQVIVDCTGEPAVILKATRRLADDGTLVLAGEPLGRQLDIDLYPEVHKRCLRIVGAPPPLVAGARTLNADSPDEATLDLFSRTLGGARSGVPLPDGAAWYRLAG